MANSSKIDLYGMTSLEDMLHLAGDLSTGCLNHTASKLHGWTHT
jgi:hypothetical protein